MVGNYAALIRDLGIELEGFAKAEVCVNTDDDKKDDKDGDSGADNKKIQAAADDGKAKSDADDHDDKGKPFGKSFSVKLADGTEAEAFDGTEALQSLAAHAAEQDAVIEDLQKAFAAAVDVIKVLRTEVATNSDMVKSYGAKAGATASSGTGRRTMVSIIEKLTPAEKAGGAAPVSREPTASSVMMKAQELRAAGRIDWAQIARIEAFQMRGLLAPPELIAHLPELVSVA